MYIEVTVQHWSLYEYHLYLAHQKRCELIALVHVGEGHNQRAKQPALLYERILYENNLLEFLFLICCGLCYIHMLLSIFICNVSQE